MVTLISALDDTEVSKKKITVNEWGVWFFLIFVILCYGLRAPEQDQPCIPRSHPSSLESKDRAGFRTLPCSINVPPKTPSQQQLGPPYVQPFKKVPEQ